MTDKQKIEILTKALQFYLNCYVSGNEEYHKNTKFNAGRDVRFPNRVGILGTTAKEALEKTNESKN